MFTRDQFELACQTFAIRHPRWSWVPGHRAGYSFLSRTCYHTHKIPVDLDVSISDLDEVEVEEDDCATAQTLLSPSFCVNEYIIYSASFNVPAFYFTIHDSNGCSLPLQGILQSSLFKVKPPRDSETTDFALTLQSSPFPLLSQGDHPTLGIPCWYLHPCESATAVNEFMAEEASNLSQETLWTRWLELWLMIVGSILNV